MKLIPTFIDFETYWDTEHTLSKMNPIDYVMHEKTQLISLSYKFGNDRAHCIFGEDAMRAWAGQVRWWDKYVIAHNNEGFDSMIAAWRLGVRPAMWGCTMAMARPVHAKTTGLSLAKLVEHYGIGVKDNSILLNTRGKRLEDFTATEIAEMRKYNTADTDQCAEVFRRLLPHYSRDELKLIDATIRMLVEPRFQVDTGMLGTELAAEKSRKKAALEVLAASLGVNTADQVMDLLGSGPKFAAFLESRGVEVPMKPSPANPEKQTYALAKTDEDFLILQEHNDDLVSAAVRTRLGVKSTILETRIEQFLAAADATGGLLPIPLKYCGADTTGRWSGWAYNPQNLPRVGKDPKPSDALRMCLTAGKGAKIVVADLSGIELRINLMLWKTPYAMALYAADPEADLYKPLASEVLGVPMEAMPKMVRQAGKAMHLGCGFGLGSAKKYRAVAKSMAGIDVTEEEGSTHILGYRKKHVEVVAGWKTCHAALPFIFNGQEADIDPWGMCYTTKEGIKTPKGLIRYPDLRQEVIVETTAEGKKAKWEWVYGQGRNRTRIYAGKIDENIVQHLARQVIADNMILVKELTGRWPALTVHDELVYVVPENEAEETLEIVHTVMRTPPVWWPELVTWSEGGIADRYGEAK